MSKNLCKKASNLLKGKELKRIWMLKNSVGVEFSDGSRLFIDVKDDNIELSVTGT